MLFLFFSLCVFYNFYTGFIATSPASRLSPNELIEVQNAVFNKEKQRQLSLIPRTEKIEVKHVGKTDPGTIFVMNKNISTPYSCAMRKSWVRIPAFPPSSNPFIFFPSVNCADELVLSDRMLGLLSVSQFLIAWYVLFTVCSLPLWFLRVLEGWFYDHSLFMYSFVFRPHPTVVRALLRESWTARDGTCVDLVPASTFQLSFLSALWDVF